MSDNPKPPTNDFDQLLQENALEAPLSTEPPIEPPKEPFVKKVLEMAKERFLETFDHSIGLVFAILSVALTHFLLAALFTGDKELLEYRALRFIIFSGEAALLLKFIWNSLRGFPKKK